MTNIVLNGAAPDMASLLLQHNLDPGCLRPFRGADGRGRVTLNAGVGPDGVQRKQTFVTNAPATLRKDEWIQFDTALVKAAQPRLKVFGDLRAAGLTYSIPNGMGKTSLQSQTVGDVTPATVSMDGLSRGQNDRITYDIGSLPLPIIHKEFDFSAREVMASRNDGTGIDVTQAELAGVAVAETIEKLTLGILPSYQFDGGKVYGYLNFPQRIAVAITDPRSAGWNPGKTLTEVLAMRSAAQARRHFGPWNIYTGLGWDGYLDADYKLAGETSSQTLRERLLKIRGINLVETADYLTGYDIVMPQMTSNVVRAVIGMELSTVQWVSHGGMQIHFAVMAILIPQLRSDGNGNTGIVHGGAVYTP